MARWSGPSAPSKSANMLTQNEDDDFGSGYVAVLELETTKRVFSCRSTYTYLS